MKPRAGAVVRSLRKVRHAAWSSPPTPLITPRSAFCKGQIESFLTDDWCQTAHEDWQRVCAAL